MMQVRWSLNSKKVAKRKHVASSFEPTTNHGGPVRQPEAPMAITSNLQPDPLKSEAPTITSCFLPGPAKLERRSGEGEAEKEISSGHANKRMAVNGGNISSHAPPKAVAMMESEDLFDPITLFTPLSVYMATDLGDPCLSSTTMPLKFMDGGASAVPAFMPIPMLPEYPPQTTHIKRSGASPPEDATQQDSLCSDVTHMSSIEGVHIADSFKDAPNEETKGAGAPDDLLDTLQLRDISSLLDFVDGGISLTLPDGMLPASELTSGDFHSEPEALFVNVDAATHGEASQSMKLEMPTLKSTKFDLLSVPGCSAQPSSSSTADTLRFDVSQDDILAGLESLPIPPLAEISPSAEMPTMPQSSPSSSLSSAPAPSSPTPTNSATIATNSTAPRRPLQQTDIVRVLNGDIPPTGDAEEMDLVMRMSVMPQVAEFFPTENIPLAQTPSSSLLPVIPLGHTQPLPSQPSMACFSQVLPSPVSVGKPLEFVTPATASSAAALEVRPLNSPLKRTTKWVHCGVEGKKTNSGYKDSKMSAAMKAKVEHMPVVKSVPTDVGKPPVKPPKKNMRGTMVSWPKKQPMLKANKTKGKALSWQSLKVLPVE